MDCRIKLYAQNKPFVFCSCRFEEYVDFPLHVSSNDIESFCLEISDMLAMNAFAYVTHFIYTHKLMSLKKLILRNKTSKVVNVDFKEVRPYMPNLCELYLSGFKVLNIDQVLEGLVILDIQDCSIDGYFSPAKFQSTINHLCLQRNTFKSLPEALDFSNYTELYSLELSKILMPCPPLLPASHCSKLLVLIVSDCFFGIEKLDPSSPYKVSDLSSWFIPESVTEMVISKCSVAYFPPLPSYLRHLDITDNLSTTFPPNILACIYLRELHYDKHKIATNILYGRFLAKINVRSLQRDYHDDAENVHNSVVQKSLIQSIERLFSVTYPNIPFTSTGCLFTDNILKDFLQCREIHCLLNVGYQEIFEKVWNRIHSILDSEMKQSALTRLREELQDSREKCFLGMISRLVNSLCGFFDDIQIHVADSEQIVAKMRAHFAKFGKVHKDTLIRELSQVTDNVQIAIDYVEEYIDSLSERQ
jgi:Leucine-rich repeat (LRR) protein